MAEKESVPLSQAAEYLLEECRMVLPGLQALFGFQLIAVFNSRWEVLGPGEQRAHLLAIGLVAVAIALIMTPAAYHRQSNPEEITSTFIRLSTQLLLWSMPPLAAGLCLDFYLIARVILHRPLASLLAVALAAVFLVFWFVLPRATGLQRIVGGRGVR
ncbi:MAG TPA: DUF6328 family protein [Gemmatimonadales bacterium]|jgi:hypothetical protein|nr:DUF6328 family protein [Gemmatimonadales bacterium]